MITHQRLPVEKHQSGSHIRQEEIVRKLGLGRLPVVGDYQVV